MPQLDPALGRGSPPVPASGLCYCPWELAGTFELPPPFHELATAGIILPLKTVFANGSLYFKFFIRGLSCPFVNSSYPLCHTRMLVLGPQASTAATVPAEASPVLSACHASAGHVDGQDCGRGAH